MEVDDYVHWVGDHVCLGYSKITFYSTALNAIVKSTRMTSSHFLYSRHFFSYKYAGSRKGVFYGVMMTASFKL